MYLKTDNVVLSAAKSKSKYLFDRDNIREFPPNISSRKLNELADHEDPTIRMSVAGHKNTSKWALDKLSKADEHPEIRKIALQHQNAGHIALSDAAKDVTNSDIRAIAAGHKNTKSRDLNHLSKDLDSIRVHVAGNSNTSKSTLNRMALKDPNSHIAEIARQTLKNVHKTDPVPTVGDKIKSKIHGWLQKKFEPKSKTPPLLTYQPKKEEEPEFKQTLPGHLTSKDLHNAAIHPSTDSELKKQIANHDNVSPKTLHILSKDRDNNVRQHALSRLSHGGWYDKNSENPIGEKSSNYKKHVNNIKEAEAYRKEAEAHLNDATVAKNRANMSQSLLDKHNRLDPKTPGHEKKRLDLEDNVDYFNKLHKEHLRQHKFHTNEYNKLSKKSQQDDEGLKPDDEGLKPADVNDPEHHKKEILKHLQNANSYNETCNKIKENIGEKNSKLKNHPEYNKYSSLHDVSTLMAKHHDDEYKKLTGKSYLSEANKKVAKNNTAAPSKPIIPTPKIANQKKITGPKKNLAWFQSLNHEQQQDHLQAHPHSKFKYQSREHLDNLDRAANSSDHEELLNLWGKRSKSIRNSLLSNPNLPHPLLHKLSRSKTSSIREAVAGHKNVSENTLNKLIHDKDDNVMMAAAKTLGSRQQNVPVEQSPVKSINKKLKPVKPVKPVEPVKPVKPVKPVENIIAPPEKTIPRKIQIRKNPNSFKPTTVKPVPELPKQPKKSRLIYRNFK